MNVEDLFVRTEGTLRGERAPGVWLTALLALLLLGVWVAWGFLVPVQRFEVSAKARLEVEQSTFALQPQVRGRVVESHLKLGRRVERDEVLLVLEDEREELQLSEERIRRAVMSPQAEALREQILSEQQAGAEDERATEASLEEARAQLREARAELSSAQADYDQQKRLLDEGLIAESEFRRYETELQTRRASEARLIASVSSVEADYRVRRNEREARIGELRVDLRRLQGSMQSAGAAIRKLEFETANRQIRAPVAGELGEIRELRVGAFVEEGELLGYVIRDGDLRVVAEFLPAAAVGRIRKGQRARLRLDGFSWVQYGSIEARVIRIAQEIRDGHIRVECEIVVEPPPTLELKHGSPGTLEVFVEELPPFRLALRAAGELLAEPRSWFASDKTK